MNLRLRPISTSLTLSLLLAAATATAAAPFNRVRVPTGAQSSTAPPPALELSGVGSSLDFGQVQVAQQLTSNTLVVSNKGKGAATALGVVAPAGFDVVDNDCGTELKPGSSCSFAVTFAPAQARAYSDSVTVESGNGVSALLRVDGVGVGAAVKLSDINFGSLMDGDQLVQAAVLRNIGVGPVRLGAPNLSGQGFTLAAGSTCGSVLVAGASCLINVGLTAKGVTAHVGTLTVPTLDAGDFQAQLSAQSRKTFSVNTTATTSGSVTIPAGVASLTLVGKGAPGTDTTWYTPAQPAQPARYYWRETQQYCSGTLTTRTTVTYPIHQPARSPNYDGDFAEYWYDRWVSGTEYDTCKQHWTGVLLSAATSAVPESSGGSKTNGKSADAVVAGTSYSFNGGYGGAATSKTYTKALDGSTQNLQLTVPAGGAITYQYSYTLPY